MDKVALYLLYLLQLRASVCLDVHGQSPWVTLYRDPEKMSVNACLEVGSTARDFLTNRTTFHCGVHSTSLEKRIYGPGIDLMIQMAFGFESRCCRHFVPYAGATAVGVMRRSS